jgi:hypothetical protein
MCRNRLFKLIVEKFFLKHWKQKQYNLKRQIGHRPKSTEVIWHSGTPALLQLKDLQKGDVLFCGKSINKKNNYIIQNFTDGVYVHCALYTGDNMIVDFVNSGIRRIMFDDFIKDYQYITVTRTPGMNSDRMSLIENFIEKLIRNNANYNYIGAMMSPFKEYSNIKWFYNSMPEENKPIKKVINKNAYFCSEFIIQCYIESRYVENTYYSKADRWTPTGLAEARIFQFAGFIANDYSHIDREDPFIRATPEILTKEGQERNKQFWDDLLEELKNKT